MSGLGGEAAAERWTDDAVHDERQRELGRLTTQQLVYRIERAEDFNYDDEQVVLNQRLARIGQTWQWGRDEAGREIVQVVPLPEDGDAK